MRNVRYWLPFIRLDTPMTCGVGLLVREGEVFFGVDGMPFPMFAA